MDVPEKIKLFIVDYDYYYSLSLKHSLEKKFGDSMHVELFRSGESCLEALRVSDEKPDVILLDYIENKELNKDNGEHTVDHIREISPDISIIILSTKKHADRAVKALGYGAHDYVMKDQFAFEHIYNAIDGCLHPSKV